jgi:hypothetical protein
MMNSRVIIFLVAAAILLAVLVPLLFIAALLFLVAPTLLAAPRATSDVSIARPRSLRTLPLFRAPPALRV